jgi:hypothetical protein
LNGPLFADLKEFFDIDTDEAVVTLTPNKSLASTEFSGNFGVLILKVSFLGCQIRKYNVKHTHTHTHTHTHPSNKSITVKELSMKIVVF